MAAEGEALAVLDDCRGEIQRLSERLETADVAQEEDAPQSDMAAAAFCVDLEGTDVQSAEFSLEVTNDERDGEPDQASASASATASASEWARQVAALTARLDELDAQRCEDRERHEEHFGHLAAQTQAATCQHQTLLAQHGSALRRQQVRASQRDRLREMRDEQRRSSEVQERLTARAVAAETAVTTLQQKTEVLERQHATLVLQARTAQRERLREMQEMKAQMKENGVLAQRLADATEQLERYKAFFGPIVPGAPVAGAGYKGQLAQPSPPPPPRAPVVLVPPLPANAVPSTLIIDSTQPQRRPSVGSVGGAGNAAAVAAGAGGGDEDWRLVWAQRLEKRREFEGRSK